MSVCCLSVCTPGARGEVASWRKFMSPRKASLFSGLVPRPGSKTYLQGGAVKEKMGGVIVELKRGRIAGIAGWVVVGMIGIMLGDGGVIVVLFNVSSDIIRFLGRCCGCFSHGKIRNHVVAKGEGNETSFAKRGNRGRYLGQKFHGKMYNLCPNT